MAVPSNPTLTQVCAEFGAPSTTPLSAFVRGGAWVPNVAANNGVPTGLPISLSQLAGAVKYIPISLGGPTSAYGETVGLPTTQTTYSNGIAITVSGGNPGPSVSWSYVSGDATMSLQFASNSLTQQWFASVNRNSSKTAVYRCTVSDGVSSATRDVTVTLAHTP